MLSKLRGLTRALQRLAGLSPLELRAPNELAIAIGRDALVLTLGPRGVTGAWVELSGGGDVAARLSESGRLTLQADGEAVAESTVTPPPELLDLLRWPVQPDDTSPN